MVALYVVSPEVATGKTAICAGIGKRLQAAGKKVGFLKLDTESGDAVFMKQILSLPEALESLCVVGGPDKLREAYTGASQGKDVVIVEGMLTEASYGIARALDARVIAVEGYSGQPSGFIEGYKKFGGNLLGVVLNRVPKSQLKRVQDSMAAHFTGAGIKLLGILPEDRVLSALTIGELADGINGKIFQGAEKSAELVEDFMLGALCVDSGLEYFGRKANKAAVLRSDRPDMQMAALETSTKCLVVSGSAAPPIYNVVNKAENKGIPIILAESDVNTVVAGIEGALDKARFSQEKKLSRLAEIMQQRLDFQTIAKALGLAG